jgi:hypothetical protein
MYELKIVRDYKEGKVTKEELDKLSTCDMHCVIDNGLSNASKEQLKTMSGEDIVNNDVSKQGYEKTK